MRPRSAPLVLALLVVVAVACGGEPRTTAEPSTPSGPTSSVPSASEPPPTTEPPQSTPTPSISGAVNLPPDAPRTFDESVDAEDVALDALAPSGAQISSTWRGVVLTGSGSATTPAVAFSWSRGDPMEADAGLEVWERADTTTEPPWRVVFAFTDRAGSGVLGVRFEAGDLTADRSTDLLSFEDLGGSGACGIWRVVAMNVDAVEQIFRTQTCDTDIRIVGGDLLQRAAVYRAGDAHCCPSAYRITRLHWSGDAWKVADRSTEPA